VFLFSRLLSISYASPSSCHPTGWSICSNRHSSIVIQLILLRVLDANLLVAPSHTKAVSSEMKRLMSLRVVGISLVNEADLNGRESLISLQICPIVQRAGQLDVAADDCL
jgi:hypothetical protein